MSKSIFGWDLPPGVTTRMIEEACGDEPCAICAKPADACICPECPTCREIGRPECYRTSPGEGFPEGHGMTLSKAQAVSRQQGRLAALRERVMEEENALDMLRERDRTEWDIEEMADPWA